MTNFGQACEISSIICRIITSKALDTASNIVRKMTNVKTQGMRTSLIEPSSVDLDTLLSNGLIQILKLQSFEKELNLYSVNNINYAMERYPDLPNMGKKRTKRFLKKANNRLNR